jgi:hypothetical protein
MNSYILNTGARRKIDHILLKNLARHAMERAFIKAQNLARHEPECLIGCAAYALDWHLIVNR